MTTFMPLSSAIKQQLLTKHYKQLDQAVFILDADKRYLSMNTAYESLTGYSENLLIGHPFGTFLSPCFTEHDPEILSDLDKHLEHSDSYRQIFALPNRAHQSLDYSIVFQKFLIEGSAFYMGSIEGVADNVVKEERSKYLLNNNSPNNSTLINKSSSSLPEQKQRLVQAIANNQFEAHYQPKVRLEDSVIVGFEALVRWRHPTRGILKPNKFIDDIIRYNLSFTLFSQLSEQVAQLLVKWQAMGFSQHICINADAAEFSHPDFNGTVSDLLDRYNIAPYQLHIEMTESSLMPNGEDIKQRLVELKKSKICLALDDFGTGYSSLSYLQKYPFDFIKIDKSFISTLNSNQTQQAIVKAILDLALALDMQAIAEGIETEQQYELLREMGCLYGQGYWLGHAVSADAATQMLRHSNK